ncbi:hypothetical protein ACIRPP_04165 [Streptomyces sp. NPDC101219]|uniref:hypothetical protein n=1 Tax=Streptomyces sp. NPDC101219 TaxID=3366131 RepID=UPI0037F612B1
MADEQNGWLDRETAERLLNGEPSAAADPVVREQAERLAAALGALAAPPPPPGRELPGEAAALAAFRTARAERPERAGATAEDEGAAVTAVADAGLVRLGAPEEHPSGTARGPRRARYLRFGLAAALTAGMVGGAAYLAGTGTQTGPSGDPVNDPGASVSASVPPPGPLVVTPSPQGAEGAATPGGAPDGQRPDGAGSAPDGSRAGKDGRSASPGPDSTQPGGGRGPGWKHVTAACRALRDGKEGGPHRRRLDSMAGGSARVGAFCKGVLAAADGGAARKGAGRGGHGHGDDRPGGHPGEGGTGDRGSGDRGKGAQQGNGNGKGKNSGNGGKSGEGEGGDDRPGRADRKHARGALLVAAAVATR